MFRILGNQRGATNLEAMIITACFIIIAVIATLAMLGQTGADTEKIEGAFEPIATVISEANEAVEQTACEIGCQAAYDTGLFNVVEYEQCLSNCSQ